VKHKKTNKDSRSQTGLW